MATVRISRHDREVIARKAVAYKFDPILKELHDQARALALQVVDKLLTDQEKKFLHHVPSNWLVPITHFDLQVAGTVIRLDWSTASSFLVPRHLANSYGVVGAFDRDHAITDQLEAWEASYKVYKDTRKIRYAQIKGVLDKVSTLKRLLEVWPEVEPFLPTNLKRPTPDNLPALPIQQLNMDLGLPVPEGEDHG